MTERRCIPVVETYCSVALKVSHGTTPQLLLALLRAIAAAEPGAGEPCRLVMPLNAISLRTKGKAET